MPLDELAREWLADPESNHLTLLGDYGTGKTWFTIKWAAELARAHLDDPAAIVPVRIELKEYSRALDFQSMIVNHISRYGILASSFVAFEHLWRAGHILLILDAFDEMATQVDAEVTHRNFDELNRALEDNPRARMLLTCRTHYFRDRPEVEEILGRQGEFSGTDLYRAIVGRPNYRIAFLQEFDEPRIQQYLKKACGPSYEEDRQTIQSIYDLKELAQRPVLLDIVVKSLPQLRAEGEVGRRVTAADLYQVYTRFWTKRDDWRTSLTQDGKLAFAHELARRLWMEQRTSVHWSELRELTQEHFKERLDLSRELEYTEHEVRTASFLTRDAEGNYGFAHRSFLEFFVAQWLAPKLLDGSAPEMRINEEIRGFVRGLLAEAMADWTPPPPPEGVAVPEGMVWVGPGPFIYGEGEGARVVRLEGGSSSPARR
jgi:predicted NACHT family NTPase